MVLHQINLLSYANGQLRHLWNSVFSFLFLSHEHD